MISNAENLINSVKNNRINNQNIKKEVILMYKSDDSSTDVINSLEDLENLINNDIEELIREYEEKSNKDNSSNNS